MPALEFFSTWFNLANEGIYSLEYLKSWKIWLEFIENGEENYFALLAYFKSHTLLEKVR